MQKIQKAGVGRIKIRIKGGLGRITVYRSNNPNKPFKKNKSKEVQPKMTSPLARFSPLPNVVMAF